MRMFGGPLDAFEVGIQALLQDHQRERHNLFGIDIADVRTVRQEEPARTELYVDPESVQIFQSAQRINQQINVGVSSGSTTYLTNSWTRSSR